jgi:hypothetical protein
MRELTELDEARITTIPQLSPPGFCLWGYGEPGRAGFPLVRR